MDNTNSIVIHLDSRFATHYIENDANGNPLTTNYVYTLVEGLPVPDSKACEVSLYTATIPYSFYNVRAGINDTFTINLGTHSGGHDETFTIPAGNYTATALKEKFKVLQKAASDSVIASLDFDIVYERETLKYKFEMNTDYPTMNFIEIHFYEASPMFGFRSTLLPVTFSGGNEAWRLNSEVCCDISDSIHGLYIRQNLASKSTLDNENGTFSNILTRLPINTNPGGIIFHTPANSTHRALTDLHSIQTIGVKLTDDRNRSIDLNGLHWQMSMMITLVNKEAMIPELTKYTRRKNEIHMMKQMINRPPPPPPKKKRTKRKSKRKTK